MQGRLGIYDKYNFDKDKIDPELDNIIHQANRLEQLGGNNQQERMIKDRRRSLDRAIWYSYQAAQIKKLESSYEQPIRALINPNKLKQDYDDKIVSAGFEYNLKCGDIIEWIGTKTYWLIYLQDLTELAYFRGDIRRCSYQISWNDESGEQKTTYAAIRGPVETKINYPGINITKATQFMEEYFTYRNNNLDYSHGQADLILLLTKRVFY